MRGKRDSRPEDDKMPYYLFIPDLEDVNGRVWKFWKGNLYRTPMPDIYPPTEDKPEGGYAAWPRGFIDGTELDTGEWV